MNTTNIILPPPTLMVCLGAGCGDIATEAKNILCRLEPRRATTLGQLEVRPDQAVDSQDLHLAKKIEDVIHDLRLHEKLIEAGLGNEHDLPLGIVVLADLADPCSVNLYPIMGILRDLLVHEPNSYSFLLLKTAMWDGSEAEKEQAARIHLHLQRLKNLANQPDWPFQMYLFDRYKEGIWEVRDDHELSLLMENFLMALLSGRFAQTVSQSFSHMEARERKAHFNSAGVAALICDPFLLQDLCALKFGAEILENEFLGRSTINPQVTENACSTLLQTLGDAHEWEQALCADLPCKPVRNGSVRFDLALADLEFEGLPIQEWEDEINGYAENFETEKLQAHKETLQKNSARLARVVLDEFEKQLNLLPQAEGLYPGMLPALFSIVQELAKLMNDRIQLCLPVQLEEQVVVSLTSEYETVFQELAQAVTDLPVPPRWVFHLWEPFSSYAKAVFNFLFLQKEHRHLLELRERTVQALGRKIAFPLEQEARRQLVDLCRPCLALLENTNESFKKLELVFQTLHGEFLNETRTISENRSPFRAQILDETLVNWGYEQAQISGKGVRSQLLEDGLLTNWQTVTGDGVRESLLNKCGQAYQELQDVSIDEYLRHWGDGSLGEISTSLAQGAVPLLRPDFDTEGSSPSYQFLYLLCDQSNSAVFLDALSGSLREWQVADTGDPYLVAFCRIRQLIPVKSLDALSRKSVIAFENLDKNEQKNLQESFDAAGKVKLP
jgi:hypothetical protein